MTGDRGRPLWKLLGGARWSEEDARVVLGEARRSGMSLGAFAEKHGLVAERLYRWARKLDGARQVVPLTNFAELTVQRDQPKLQVEIELPSGRIVRVGADIHPDALRRLLDAIEGDAEC